MSWQKLLIDSIPTPIELLRFLGLESHQALMSQHADSQFAFKVTRRFANNMRQGDPADPLLLQVLPSPTELMQSAHFSTDPLDEKTATVTPGILHKYHGRALLIASSACAINCRYCFRRTFPYRENTPGLKGWRNSLDYIRGDTSIEEVILSGGDPLLLTDKHLLSIIEQLREIDHVTTLRFHTRIPIVLPERITDTLTRQLIRSGKSIVIVVHSNHPNEIDTTVFHTLRQLREQGIVLLNQSVLLNRVNNNADTLAALSKQLFAAGTLPYYLHMLDPVEGTTAFEVSDAQAQKIMTTLRARLPGYLVPTLVREQAGEANKTPLS